MPTPLETEPLQCFMTTLSKDGVVQERGKMFWRDADEAIVYARMMNYSIDLEACNGCWLCLPAFRLPDPA